jgi:hypothetical protein
MPIYRQGDVLMQSVEAKDLPSGEWKTSRRLVLAEGEATGHAHVLIADPTVPEIEFLEKDATLYLKVAEPSPLIHEEHARITVEPGIYKVQKGREYSPEAIRSVMD